MKRIIGIILAVTLSGLLFSQSAPATHDQGQGKSQDSDHENTVDSRSVASEPLSGLLFLAGAGLIGYRLRKNSKMK